MRTLTSPLLCVCLILNSPDQDMLLDTWQDMRPRGTPLLVPIPIHTLDLLLPNTSPLNVWIEFLWFRSNNGQHKRRGVLSVSYPATYAFLWSSATVVTPVSVLVFDIQPSRGSADQFSETSHSSQFTSAGSKEKERKDIQQCRHFYRPLGMLFVAFRCLVRNYETICSLKSCKFQEYGSACMHGCMQTWITCTLFGHCDADRGELITSLCACVYQILLA